MGVLFPTIYKVIRRQKGSYENGMWRFSTEGEPDNVPLKIEPSSDADYMRTQAIIGGGRVTAMMTATAELDADLKVAGSDGYSGDIVIYNDRRWIVIGSARFDAFGSSDTAHSRYLLTLEAEHSKGESLS